MPPEPVDIIGAVEMLLVMLEDEESVIGGTLVMRVVVGAAVVAGTVVTGKAHTGRPNAEGLSCAHSPSRAHRIETSAPFATSPSK